MQDGGRRTAGRHFAVDPTLPPIEAEQNGTVADLEPHLTCSSPLHLWKLPLNGSRQDERSLTYGEGQPATAPTDGELRLPTLS